MASPLRATIDTMPPGAARRARASTALRRSGRYISTPWHRTTSEAVDPATSARPSRSVATRVTRRASAGVRPAAASGQLTGDHLLAHDVAQVAEPLEPGPLPGDEGVVSHPPNLPI